MAAEPESDANYQMNQQPSKDDDSVPVTWENFPRAQLHKEMETFAEWGGFSEFYHFRTLIPLDKQVETLPNRDTLYSIGVFDLTEPVTITKPDTGDRYQSMIVLNEDQYVKMFEYGPGEYTLTQDEIGTRYAAVLVRTFVDPNDPDDVETAHGLQDGLTVSQGSVGTLEIPNWDSQSRDELFDAIVTIGKTMDDFRGACGDVDEVHPVKFLLQSVTTFGFPESEALYVPRIPDQNDGETPHILTVEDVPVNGFWSITVYNSDWYLEENEYDAYVVNNVTAEQADDGSVMVHFGGDPDQPNFIYTPEEWNYVIRLYQPHEEIIDGSYQFPESQPVE
ncbi:hypothetical protein HAPAU_36850 [Halalkalicoccus paucihalophilus]|uniref:DUF1214 domain-containing protein n=1 Tax=Halalkalicoccus paucihalophilus TaxID=1008153 RepID=A0A151A9E2_9EURY|nr:DUF1214 domain-containing protein [Halalkalicoccus paucihalophilus]KYH24214.1 hypothetical protein HAPAU_36850 [Halalkalicoccus paucihalophilus]